MDTRRAEALRAVVQASSAVLQALDRRTTAIFAAHEAGATLTELAVISGCSTVELTTIIDKARQEREANEYSARNAQFGRQELLGHPVVADNAGNSVDRPAP